MDEGTLGVHQVKLVVKPGPGLSDGSGVAKHTHSPADRGKVTSRKDCRGLVVDAYFETSRTPVYELDAPLGLDGGDGSIDVLRNDVTSIEQTASHVLPMSGITFHHLIGRL